MVPALALWLPILLSAVLVFAVSAVIHMFLPWHKADLDDLPDEEAVRRALGPLSLPSGSYVVPKARSGADFKDPAFIQKMEEGPVLLMDVRPSGPPTMGKQFAQWFVYALVVGLFAAYVAGRALAPGAPYLEVFRFVGSAAFIGYALALWQMPIFYGKKWAWAATFTLDGFIYACLTAGVFGWLWPA